MRAVLAQDVGVLDDVDRAELRPAQRRLAGRRRRELREIAHEQAGHDATRLRRVSAPQASRHRQARPYSRAAASASS